MTAKPYIPNGRLPVEPAFPQAGAPHPRTRKFLVGAALMLVTALAALDLNIVSTAVPTIVGKLGGLPLLPWLIEAFLLTSTATVPLFGKLSDIYGRKTLLLFGTGLFILGSALCGFAGSMGQLIAFRAVQGLGASCMVTVTATLIGDLFTVEERARVLGLFSAVWGVSSVLGPVAGGLIVSTIGWPWIFFVNLPLGLLSILLLWRFLWEPARPSGSLSRIDFPGAIAITLGIAALLLALSFGSGLGWLSAQVAGLVGTGIVLLVAFYFIEGRAIEPVIPLGMLRERLLGVSALTAFLANCVLIGSGSYLPLLVQGVWQGTPLEAGLAIAPLSIGWTIASIFAGGLIVRLGYWPGLFAGAVLVLMGGIIWLPLGLASPVWLLPVGAFVQGVGFGFCFPSLLIAVQSSVDWEKRGAVTAIYQFSCNMGSTISAAILGVALTGGLAARLATIAQPGSPAGAASGSASSQLGAASVLLDPVRRVSLDPQYRLALQNALGDAMSTVIWLMALFALLTLFATWFFPRLGADHGAMAERGGP